jgi:hypothetical protein
MTYFGSHSAIFQFSFCSNSRVITPLYIVNVKFLSVRTLGAKVYLHSFFTSALDGGELLASQPRPLYPCGKISHYPQNTGIVGPKAGLDILENSKSFRLLTTQPRLLGLPASNLVTSVSFYAKYFCVPSYICGRKRKKKVCA